MPAAAKPVSRLRQEDAARLMYAIDRAIIAAVEADNTRVLRCAKAVQNKFATRDDRARKRVADLVASMVEEE